MRTIIHAGIAALFLITITACSDSSEPAEQAPQTDARTAFFENLSELCGETFTGQSTFPDNQDHPLVGTELRTHVSQCDDSMIRIELYRDSDYWHGAWVIERREAGLHLFHDHLGEARTMEDLGEGDYHGYGGYASEAGTATIQFFHADGATADIIPEAVTNVWMMELDLEGGRFIYYLERHNEPRFRAELVRQ
jgi:hypothetical protein